MLRNVLFYGKKEDLPEVTKLRAGQLNMVYETGFLRYIRLGQHEVLRMINHTVRDHNWKTISLTISDEFIDIADRSFTITYTARARQDEVDFLWNCRIQGSEDSSLIFTIQGEAISGFLRNRIGFTVLHPISECAGRNVKITHSDGSSEILTFPVSISPHQPFADIKVMEWQTGDSKAILEFEGDIFETEDQRNWIDESYKTYCTPLALPFPVRINKGDSVTQVVRLKMPGDLDNIDYKVPGPAVGLSSIPCPLPRIGICQSSEVEHLSSTETENLRKIGFDHYRADLKLYTADWQLHWGRLKKESASLGIPLELSLFFDKPDTEIESFASGMNPDRPPVSMINIFNKNTLTTPEDTLRIVLPKLNHIFPEADIGAGTDAFFTQLNRNRLAVKGLDYLVFSINPQVHAYDNDSLVETVNSVPCTVKTAREFSTDKAVVISPVTFKMRWNPDAMGGASSSKNHLPPEVDPRQMSLFGAAWLIGLLNNLLPEKPKALTLFETVGLKGIIQSSSPMHADQFFAPAGMIYPLYHIFRIILENKNDNFYQVTSSQPRHFGGLAWGKSGPDTLLLANFRPEEIRVQLPGQFQKGAVSTIDENSFKKIMYDPEAVNLLYEKHPGPYLRIMPYGINILKT